MAHAGPWVGEGRRLLMRVQEECRLSADLWLIAHVAGQFVLLPTADSFVRRVEWESDFLGLVPSAISSMQGHAGLRKRCP